MTKLLRRTAMISLLCLVPLAARGHAFITPYILPVPLWIYVYACVATLILTFALLGYLMGMPAPPPVLRRRGICFGISRRAAQWGLLLARTVACICLLLVVVAGFIADSAPTNNLAITLFWSVFLLGGTYATLVIGDVYALINPWRSLLAALERFGIDFSRPRISYPPGFGYWPALLIYVLLVWAELFLRPSPFWLSAALLLYTTVTVLGAAAFGKHVWLERGEMFGVMFWLVGKLAPIKYTQQLGSQPLCIHIRAPLSGALDDRPEHMSLVLFVLFMLSSTAYDTIHDTALWIGLFWGNMPQLLETLWDIKLADTQTKLMGWYLAYRQVGLAVFPILYLSLYALVLQWAKVLVRVHYPLRNLVLGFCYTLLPISVSYHFAHYFAFLVDQWVQLPRLLADTLQLGGNLNSTSTVVKPSLPMGLIWHTQVSAILLGHVGSIYLAHIVSLNTFGQRRRIVSQLPLLFLMVIYTIVGLRIISLPLGSE